MDAIQDQNPPFTFNDGADIKYSLPQFLLIGGTNTLDFSRISLHQTPLPTRFFEPLGSYVYLRQRYLLQQFCHESQANGALAPSSAMNSLQSSLCTSSYTSPYKKKLYTGVRQRHSGKWVVEIRLPHNRVRVWLGTYNKAKAIAYAYDRAAYKLRGEYAHLNFSNLTDPSELGFRDCEKLNALKNSMDAKIQAICQKVKRERAKKNGKKSGVGCGRGNGNEVVKAMKVDSSSSSLSLLWSPLALGDS